MATLEPIFPAPDPSAVIELGCSFRTAVSSLAGLRAAIAGSTASHLIAIAAPAPGVGVGAGACVGPVRLRVLLHRDIDSADLLRACFEAFVLQAALQRAGEPRSAQHERQMAEVPGLPRALVEAAADWRAATTSAAATRLGTVEALRRQSDGHAGRLFEGFLASCVEQGWRMEKTQLDVAGHRGDW